jgi:hypothetical protein
MSIYLNWRLDGRGLRKWMDTEDMPRVMRLVVPVGEDDFQVDIRKFSMPTHTTAGEGPCAPDWDEAAEVVARMFVRLVDEGRKPRGMPVGKDRRSEVGGRREDGGDDRWAVVEEQGGAP